MIDEEERKGWSTISVLFICIWIVVSFYIIFIIIPYAVFILTLTNNIKLVVLFYIRTTSLLDRKGIEWKKGLFLLFFYNIIVLIVCCFLFFLLSFFFRWLSSFY